MAYPTHDFLLRVPALTNTPSYFSDYLCLFLDETQLKTESPYLLYESDDYIQQILSDLTDYEAGSFHVVLSLIDDSKLFAHLIWTLAKNNSIGGVSVDYLDIVLTPNGVTGAQFSRLFACAHDGGKGDLEYLLDLKGQLHLTSRLPDDMTIVGDFGTELFGSVKRSPSSLTIQGKLPLTKIPIQVAQDPIALPLSLTVTGDMVVSTQFVKLPDVLKVGGCLSALSFHLLGTCECSQLIIKVLESEKPPLYPWLQLSSNKVSVL